MALAMARPWKHPKTGYYWLRKRVPDDLRPIVGKLEHKQSLRTKDPGEARRLHAEKLAELEARWECLRHPPAESPEASQLIHLSERQAHERAAWVYGYWLNRHKENPSTQTKWRTDLYDKLWLDQLAFIERVESENVVAVKEMERFCRSEAETYLLVKDLEVDEASKARLEKAIAAATQRASVVLAKWSQGDFTETLVPARLADDPRSKPDKAPLTFEFLFEGWAAERKPLPKTVYEYRRVVRDFGAFVRHDDASKVAPSDVVKWKTHLIEEELHPKTIKDAKLAPLRAIFQWGVANHHLPSNPAAQITIEVKRRAGEAKRGFTELEAIRILDAARKENDAARRWIPLLGAYSGARIAELAQLRAEDILPIAGIACMKITPEAGPLKTLSSERIVPLHPAVIEAGFLEYAQTAARGPLFPSIKPNVFGSRGGNATKVIGRWVRGLGIDDPRLSPSHSWRHRFKTLARQHGLAPDVSDAITGHSARSVADRYGEFPVDALYREIVKIPSFGTSQPQHDLRNFSSNAAVTDD